MNFVAANAHVCRYPISRFHGNRVTVGAGSLRIYASSRAFTRGCSAGLRYNSSQNTSQTNPNAPVITNVHRQPQRNAIGGTINGVTIAPMLVPELKMPTANARSFFGNHSATVFRLAGKTPASPNPRANRAAENPNNELTSACDIAATLQNAIASE